MSSKKGFTHDSIDNATIEWYTPKWIFDELNIEFDLDPCHARVRIPWIPVKETYCLPNDGLSLEWKGNVWLNPPYGKHTPDWLRKMHQHRNGIALLFSRTDCKWFHDYVAKADALLFLTGRVKFVDGMGVTGKSGAGSGSMLVSWGEGNSKALYDMRDRGLYISLGDMK